MKSKKCPICKLENNLRKVNLKSVEKIAGKSLKEILESVCGFQLNNVNFDGKCTACSECTLKLVQTELFVTKVRLAFKAEAEGSPVINGAAEEKEDSINKTLDESALAKPVSDPYKCDVCNFHCKLDWVLRKHLAKEHNITNAKIYKCPTCPQAFEKKGGLKVHGRWCHKTRNFPCPHCDKSFFLDKILATHLLRHKYDKIKPPGKNAMKIVDENDITNNDTVDHIPYNDDKTDDIERFKCEHCEYNTKSSKKLSKHIKNEHPDKNNADQIESNAESIVGKKKKRFNCSLALDDDDAFDNSINKNWNDKDDQDTTLENRKRARLECDMCDYITTSTKKLTKHEEMKHTKENLSSTPKPLNKVKKHAKSIDISGIDVNDSTTAMSSFICPKNDCKKIFTSNSALKNHDLVHKKAQEMENNNIHACLICAKKFWDLKDLRSHMSKYHLDGDDDSDSNTCSHCGAKFNSIEKLEKHVSSEKCKTFAYSCTMPQCNRRFERFAKMQIHKSKAHCNDITKNGNKDED